MGERSLEDEGRLAGRLFQRLQEVILCVGAHPLCVLDNNYPAVTFKRSVGRQLIDEFDGIDADISNFARGGDDLNVWMVARHDFATGQALVTGVGIAFAAIDRLGKLKRRKSFAYAFGAPKEKAIGNPLLLDNILQEAKGYCLIFNVMKTHGV